ncbi:hypothetical protein F5884DRAFT_862149 [Xylogone sp. PMI_703]|nr:hypothetical protein F5884DRAFT_862149 [Xylogone sp. PMI_703]
MEHIDSIPATYLIGSFLATHLIFTDTYRATDPRDKLFALQSILPGSIGKLINVDYTESCEDAFKRATARCYNSKTQLLPTASFSLLIETQENTDSPSWVLDFSYSDACFKNNESIRSLTDVVTLEGSLYRRAMDSPITKLSHNEPCFATQRTLFCTGFSIDRIIEVGLIPDFSDEGDKISMEALLFVYVIIVQCNALRAFYQPPPSYPITDEEKDRELIEYVTFFFHLLGGELFEDDVDGLLRQRQEAIAGKPYFITDRGFVGIATLPVQKDDELCFIYSAPVYFILREMKDSIGISVGEKEHKIVARTTVHEISDEMEARIKCLPPCQFRII